LFLSDKSFINFVLQERGQDCPEVWPEKEEDVGTMNDKRDICTKKLNTKSFISQKIFSIEKQMFKIFHRV
jgi:exopolysaccharide biosynthesis protein